jgi:amidase
VDRATDLLPDLERQHRAYWQMLNIAMTIRTAPPAAGQDAPTLTGWFDLHDEQARIQRQWRRLFGRYDAVIAPTVGMTAFPHDDTPLAQRRLSIDGTDTLFFHQFAFPGLATFPMLPATSVPIGKDRDGLPIGVQVIADTFSDHKAIAIAAAAHHLIGS